MTSLARRLESLGAYRDLVAWCEPFGDDAAGALAACPRGDWVLAIAAAEARPRAAIVRAACACAELAIELVDPGAIAPALDAIAAARAWAATAEAVDPGIAGACEALAGHPDPLVQSAAIAALSCVLAIDEPREAPAAAASAVSAAALHSAECGAEAAISFAYRRSAELARDALR